VNPKTFECGGERKKMFAFAGNGTLVIQLLLAKI
jgi:hypothetical protein